MANGSKFKSNIPCLSSIADVYSISVFTSKKLLNR